MRSREEVIAKRLAESPPSAQGIMRRAYSGEAGRAGAVKAMCLHCTGFQRETVRDCTGFSCPLWMYRPYQGNDSEDETAQISGSVEAI